MNRETEKRILLEKIQGYKRLHEIDVATWRERTAEERLNSLGQLVKFAKENGIVPPDDSEIVRERWKLIRQRWEERGFREH